MKEIFDKLANEGGCLVNSADCSEMEISDARSRGDFYLDGSVGFVRRLPQWLAKHCRFARGYKESESRVVYRTKTSFGWIDPRNAFYDRLKKDAVEWGDITNIYTGSEPAVKENKE